MSNKIANRNNKYNCFTLLYRDFIIIKSNETEIKIIIKNHLLDLL